MLPLAHLSPHSVGERCRQKSPGEGLQGVDEHRQASSLSCEICMPGATVASPTVSVCCFRHHQSVAQSISVQ